MWFFVNTELYHFERNINNHTKTLTRLLSRGVHVSEFFCNVLLGKLKIAFPKQDQYKQL